MAQSDLPAKIAGDIEGLVPAPVRKLWGIYSDGVDKISGKHGSSTDRGKLPEEWEEANKRSRERQVGRKLTAKGPTLGGKRVAKKKAATKPVAKKR